MTVHALTHQHLAFNHRSICWISLVPMAWVASGFQFAIFVFCGHYGFMAEIHKVWLFCPGGPGFVRILVRIEHGFFPRHTVVVGSQIAIPIVACRTFADGGNAFKPSWHTVQSSIPYLATWVLCIKGIFLEALGCILVLHAFWDTPKKSHAKRTNGIKKSNNERFTWILLTFIIE